ncbi:MAG: hypothetical protein R3C97_15150 [Geminicoccaceae bacterium]
MCAAAGVSPPRVAGQTVVDTLRRAARQFAAGMANGSRIVDAIGYRVHFWPEPDPYYRSIAIPRDRPCCGQARHPRHDRGFHRPKSHLGSNSSVNCTPVSRTHCERMAFARNLRAGDGADLAT